MELVFIGDANHDIYAKEDKATNKITFWALSKTGDPNGNSYFGDVSHIKRLMDFDKKVGRNFIDSHQPTERAREIFSGMAHHLVGAEGKEFWLLRA